MDNAIRPSTTDRPARTAVSEGTTRRGFFGYLLALIAVPVLLPPRASATTVPPARFGVTR